MSRELGLEIESGRGKMRKYGKKGEKREI